MAVISTTQFKVYANITLTTWDALLAVLIAAAQADAERFCGRTFDTASFTELYDGGDSGLLLLKSAPITSITSVKYVAQDGTKTLIPSTSYKYNWETGELWLTPLGATKLTSYDTIGAPFSNWTQGPRFVRGVQNYEVIYVGGYGGTYTMPADLQLAMYEYVGFLFAPLKVGLPNMAIKSETLGDYSYVRSDATQTGAARTAFLEARFGRFRRRVP